MSNPEALPLNLKFIFANHDGVIVEYSADSTMYIKDLKAELLGRWPQGVEPVEDMGYVRLICMGIGILPDVKTLSECKVPHFDTHPTPVNVSVRPKDVKLTTTGIELGTKEGASGSDASTSCCTIS